MHSAILLFAVLLITLVLFIWNRWRYDVVAFIALMASVGLGLVPFSEAYTGFSNPAVITVACIMIITQAITKSGIVDFVVNKLTPLASKNVTLHLGLLCFVTALLSGFMNNIGALALMMPIAIETAHKSKRSPSLLLMPLALASALGGLMTSIGTPPNLLIASFRAQIHGAPFSMFDFAPVGVGVAVVGVLFIVLLGWRLLPAHRKASSDAADMFHMEDYIAELKVTEDSKIVDKSIREIEQNYEGDFIIVGLIRGRSKRLAVRPLARLHAGDILIIEASHKDLAQLVKAAKLEVVGDKRQTQDLLRSDDIQLMEAVIPAGSRIEGRSSQLIRLRTRYRINLLALSRKGRGFKERLNQVRLQAGDVVLLQGEAENLRETAVSLGFLPLVERQLDVGLQRSGLLSMGIFALSIMLTALHILPVHIAFSFAVLAMVLVNLIPARMIYESIDFSIIVLLGAMIPVGGALQATGGTELLANLFVHMGGTWPAVFLLGLLLFVTMTLSDVINNAATAVIMAPIGISIANALQVSADPFLMTVALGASCSFLTPIGHQNNTLVMGPGGYQFGDYIRIGLPLEILVMLVGLPLIIWTWPF